MKKTVAIVGVGLIGGSLGQALRRSGRYRVLGIARRAETLREAKRFRAIDEGSVQLADVSKADIVVIATPVAIIEPTLARLAPYLAKRAIVTDVGSVKGEVMRGAARARLPKGVTFVGSHPIAGSHRTGVAAAKPDLFDGAICVLVGPPSQALRVIGRMWKTAGAKTVRMSAETHDAALAVTSHLPHVIAHALVHTVAGRREHNQLKRLMAGSFRDTTRVASSDPVQWAQIFKANLPAVQRAVRAFAIELKRLEQQLSRPTLRAHLTRSQRFRKPLFANA